MGNTGGGDGIGSDDYVTERTNGADYSHLFAHAGQDVRWWTPASFGDVVLACPIVMFAFSCQVNVCAIYEELGGSRSGTGSDANGGGPSAAADSNAADLTRTRRRGNISGPPSHHPDDYEDNEDSSRRKAAQMVRVTRAAVGICVILYSLIGIFAYLDFGDATADNVLKNYHVRETRDPMMIAAFAFTTIAVVLAFPLNVFPARVTLDGVVQRMVIGNQGGDDSIGDNIGSSERIASEDGALERPLLEEDGIGEQISPTGARSTPDSDRPSSPSSRSRHVVLTLIISGGALLAALVVPDISVVFGIMGGTASSVICFVFPGLFVLEMKQAGDDDDIPPQLSPTRWRTVQAWSLIVGGSLIGILSTCITLYNMFV